MKDLELRGFLKEGNMIRTKHCDSPNWVKNMVYAINDDYIEIDIGLEKDYIDNVIMIGDTMKCKYTDNDYEYTLTGWVSRIKVEFPQSITIKVHDMNKFQNKRDSYRYDVYLCSVIKSGEKDDKGLFAIMINLSKTGAAFVIKEEIESQLGMGVIGNNEKIFNFEIYVSPAKQLSFQGIIKRKGRNDKGIEYGVKIVEMDAKSEKILDEFINELEKKDKEFYNKRSGFWSQHSKYNK